MTVKKIKWILLFYYGSIFSRRVCCFFILMLHSTMGLFWFIWNTLSQYLPFTALLNREFVGSFEHNLDGFLFNNFIYFKCPRWGWIRTMLGSPQTTIKIDSLYQGTCNMSSKGGEEHPNNLVLFWRRERFMTVVTFKFSAHKLYSNHHEVYACV